MKFSATTLSAVACNEQRHRDEQRHHHRHGKTYQENSDAPPNNIGTSSAIQQDGTSSTGILVGAVNKCIPSSVTVGGNDPTEGPSRGDIPTQPAKDIPAGKTIPPGKANNSVGVERRLCCDHVVSPTATQSTKKTATVRNIPNGTKDDTVRTEAISKANKEETSSNDDGIGNDNAIGNDKVIGKDNGINDTNRTDATRAEIGNAKNNDIAKNDNVIGNAKHEDIAKNDDTMIPKNDDTCTSNWMPVGYNCSNGNGNGAMNIRMDMNNRADVVSNTWLLQGKTHSSNASMVVNLAPPNAEASCGSSGPVDPPPNGIKSVGTHSIPACFGSFDGMIDSSKQQAICEMKGCQRPMVCRSAAFSGVLLICLAAAALWCGDLDVSQITRGNPGPIDRQGGQPRADTIGSVNEGKASPSGSHDQTFSSVQSGKSDQGVPPLATYRYEQSSHQERSLAESKSNPEGGLSVLDVDYLRCSANIQQFSSYVYIEVVLEKELMPSMEEIRALEDSFVDTYNRYVPYQALPLLNSEL